MHAQYPADVALFAAVVEHGGFTAAAREVGVAKSTVSKSVRRLEASLGVSLLARTTRTVRPTPAGETYYAACARALELIREAGAEVGALQGSLRGRLRVSLPVSLGRGRLARPIEDFAAAHPDVELDLELSDRASDLVADGLDIAIRVGRLSDSTLVARKLSEVRFLVVGSPAYLARHGAPAAPEDLAGHECLLYRHQATGADWLLHGDSGPQRVRVAGRLRSNHGETLADAAVAGLGLALLPEFIVASHIAAGRLEAVLDEACRTTAPLHALRPPGRYPPTRVRVFIDAMQDALRDR